MAVGPFNFYEQGLRDIQKGLVDFENDTIKAALLDTVHVVDLVGDQFFAAVETDECQDADYTAGGILVGGKLISNVSNTVQYDCDNLNYGDSVTIAARYCVLYKDTGIAASSNLILIADLNDTGGNLSSTNADFKVNISANGLHRLLTNQGV